MSSCEEDPGGKFTKSMESSSDAVDAANSRVAELLRSPDDLVKTSLLRKRLATEKATIDAQLKTGVKVQLDNTQEGIETLTTSVQQMLLIKENMQAIDRLCSEAQGMIKHFPRINKVISQIHRNFVATQETVQKLQEMYSTVDQIQNLLQQDMLNVYGPARNLLNVHYQLFRLQEFRDNTMYQAKNSSLGGDVLTLEQYFKRLDELSLDFVEYLWTLAKNIMEFARKGQGSVIVCLIKVIEAEERADERATAAEHARHSHQDLAVKFKSIQTSPRVIKSFRSQFQDKLQDSISELFDNFYAEFGDDTMKLLDAADFIYDDLNVVYQEIVPRFPKKYSIFSVYVLAYHRHLYNIFDKIINSDPDARTILRLIRWVRQYYKKMNKDFRISEDILEPPLLNGNEQELIDDYIKLIKRKLDEWMTNLMNDETKDFVERSKAPELDANKLYGLSGSVIMFQMVNQQIDVAAESGQGKILADVVKECAKSMKASQEVWMKLLTLELKRQIEKPDEAPPGFVEYVIALANDQIRCADFTDAIVNRLANSLSEKYRNQINTDLNDAMDGFFMVAQAAKDTLIDIVFNDLKLPFSQLYTPNWYQEDPMVLIIETIKDYNDNDFQPHMNEYLLDKLMSNILERFIIAYIEAIKNKGAKFKKPECLDRARSDLGTALTFFQQQHIPASELKNTFDVIHRIHQLLESNRKSIFLDYYSMKKIYGDMPIGFIEEILTKRDDLEKSHVKEIMDNIKSKNKEIGEYTGKPTIFSKINW
ncbi:1778_t:CDS:2 [Acaulospora morrowiae]|uniref:1778_t:CDS:1 n=1 Tax=Acaulospora morrowiae TaxID=94023 RepID=A0A9N9H038_9GLOM|nr:1778_t:CDS:2 [Acaulospora morrowiae]